MWQNVSLLCICLPFGYNMRYPESCCINNDPLPTIHTSIGSLVHFRWSKCKSYRELWNWSNAFKRCEECKFILYNILFDNNNQENGKRVIKAGKKKHVKMIKLKGGSHTHISSVLSTKYQDSTEQLSLFIIKLKIIIKMANNYLISWRTLLA